MNPIIRVLMCEIVGKAVLFGYRSDGQLLLLWGAKKVARCEFVGQLSQQPAPQPVASCVNAPEAVHLTKICPSVNF